MERAVVDELQIRRALAEYCQLCDDGDFDALLARFTPDATFCFGARIVQGRAALRSWFEVTQSPARRGKHITANALVDVDGDRAEVRSDFVFLTLTDRVLRPLVTGRYRDEFRRIDGVWLIGRREATTLGGVS